MRIAVNVVTILILLFPCMVSAKTIHVFVALADNQNQWIAPVPQALGNGEDPRNNLYWGALYGVRTYFRKAPDWEYLEGVKQPSGAILERIVFRHRNSGFFLIADAYKGSEITAAIKAFLNAAAGNYPGRILLNHQPLMTHGGADLVVYIGHNGMMEPLVNIRVRLERIKRGKQPREAIILACQSKRYFEKRLEKLGSKGLLLTTGNMAPEAYTLHAALDAWLKPLSGEKIKEQAARAYSKYQKISLRSARMLFYSSQ